MASNRRRVVKPSRTVSILRFIEESASRAQGYKMIPKGLFYAKAGKGVGRKP